MLVRVGPLYDVVGTSSNRHSHEELEGLDGEDSEDDDVEDDEPVALSFPLLSLSAW